ncbi:MAG TPA: hypothetical protein P5146_09655 [Desulfomonilia bacterium]|jgi:hypothetical protein|nr:hypothetical protein [Deltaproteobacteria bacterium]MDI9542768.1 hypothetical protein [Pseudomonadota bacterium]HPX49663.1 hypothetical protein [Deltaproteobacteria bacterium]HRR69545.1 hypothetical protein [Desulfomonilia bacterium]
MSRRSETHWIETLWKRVAARQPLLKWCARLLDAAAPPALGLLPRTEAASLFEPELCSDSDTGLTKDFICRAM